MRVLFVIPYVPNPIRARSYNFIGYLARRGHEIDLATVTSEDSDLQDIENLRRICRNIIDVRKSKIHSWLDCLLALPTSKPLQSVYSWTRNLIRKIHADILHNTDGQKIDLIHIEHLRGARFGLSMLERMSFGAKKIPLVWDSVDCISWLFSQSAQLNQSTFGRTINRLELSRTMNFERELVRRFRHILVTSKKDRDAFTALAPEAKWASKIDIVPTGVDLERFFPDHVEREPASLVVSGKMSYHANISMVTHLMENIMPRVWERKPEVKVALVGKDPPQKVKAYAADPRVEVTGFVREITPYLQRATVAVAPLLYGAGIQTKVIEAMACQTPVITTSYGNSGVGAKPGEELIIADQSEEFAGHILDLLNNPERSRSLAAAGRKYVETTYDWEIIIKDVERLYNTYING